MAVIEGAGSLRHTRRGHTDWRIRRLFFQDMFSKNQYIHSRSQETIQGLVGPEHDWFIFVKRCIQQNTHAGYALERFDQPPI